jgi:DNA-binding transcriptional ArsR family regulator
MKNFSNEAYYSLFSALANRTRLAIIDVLENSPKSIPEVAAALKQKQDIVSANLKQLEKCVLVVSESSGNERVYSLNKEIIEPLSHILELHTTKYCPTLSECIPPKKLREYMKQEATKKTFIEHA